MRGLPLNLNGIRLKATFSQRETDDAFSLFSAVTDFRSYFQRRVPSRKTNPPFSRRRFWPMHYAHLNFVSPMRRRRTAFVRNSARDVFRRNEPRGAPFCAFRRVSFGKWKPRIRVLVDISTSRDFRLHLVLHAVVVNYDRNVSRLEKFKEVIF